ncbi:MAG: AAA family ATPase [Clostridia bacterium]|nr:AAA family ATPase [Clostridia bacterium]
MSKSIEIKNTKGIKHLNFCLPDNNDVYLIVGPNGAGKTTLLICIDRICNPYAFARGFSHPKNIIGYDEYNNSEIQYNNESICVNFRKKKWKWYASPRKGNAELLKSFGFTDSVFIKADSKRIDATQDEIEKGNVQAADTSIVQIMNDIFETQRFRNLRKLKVTHGRGRASSFFNIIKDGPSYYTEKRFSSGELAILHLIQGINKAVDGAIVLLDEAEMALHPRVQINLLNYLKRISKEKNLMVLISTHSPTMIKATNPNRIIMLDTDNTGNISIVSPCYPALALGRVDYEESSGFDYIFFVEDEMARSLLKKIVNKYISLVTKHITSSTSIIPVGGYRETSKMAVNTAKQLFSKSKVFAFVDTDALSNLDENPEYKQYYEDHKDIIYDLTYTPEVKIIDVLTSNNYAMEEIKKRFHCEIKTIIESDAYKKCIKENERSAAKDKFYVIVDNCCSTCGDCETLVIDTLIDIVVNLLEEGEIKRILGPVFNKTI